jgi:PadR family transcriptional regulator, regulatory protein PadR
LDGRLRRYYRITDEGATELAAEVGRLRANAAASRLGLTGGTI